MERKESFGETAKKTAKEAVRHPLQRFTSPSRGVSLAVHLVSMASFVKSFHFLQVFPNPLVAEAYGSHFQFLTILGLTLATITCALGLLADIFLSTKLFKAKNALSIVSTPMESLISILYWGLILIDKKLVVPDGMGIPLDADLGLHAAPTVFLILDLVFFSPPWSVTFASALTTSGFAATCYWFWVERCFSFNGWYPYPIFTMLNTLQRAGLFGFAAVVMAASTLALKWGYHKLNGHNML
ncbi:FAR-17a/AIG1-like protein [Ascosphaera apis ARSEF 7405]|uniref:FAR-17a/AIG1-like protein n=1 Tax=Ascosphaera apis ARSEF 7405 TaxID=392613 RepID=A0A162I090_9EURO|nr:FAR-17a/AIG1-like protein [Ascosphaera apis ARSEF 7405]